MTNITLHGEMAEHVGRENWNLKVNLQYPGFIGSTSSAMSSYTRLSRVLEES